MNEANANARPENSTTLSSGDRAVIHINNSNINLGAGGSANVGNRAPEQRELQEQQRNTVTEPPKKDGKDLSWLCAGKIAFYKRRPLSQTTKTVFYGKQEFLPEYWREVAIKVIKYNEKNLSELNLLKKLSHPNIVQLFDAGKHMGKFGDHIYIVMELCSQTLTTYVDRNPFSFQKFYSFVKQIVEGLDYLHSNNVTHRDLKPDNVLFCICRKIVKLSDFGLSKEIPVGQSSVTVTKVGAGTDGYRPPETYQNTPRVSRSIDIFPFGLVTHFIFTNGEHAYGADPNDWSVNIRTNQNRDLTKIPNFEEPHTHKREQLIDLLLQTLRHNPKDRPTIHEIKQSAFFTGLEKDDRDVPGTSRKRKSKESTEDSDQTSRTKETKRNLSDEQFAESPQAISTNSIKFASVIHEGKFVSIRKGYWKAKLVAVKEYKKDKIKLFNREFCSLNALRHDNIVRLVGKISEEPACLVLEYLENGNLRDYLRWVVAVSLVERMNMIQQITCGMTFLSNKKFIHGDLRAKNILVGKTGVYKIGGFHLSQSEADDEAHDEAGSTFQIRWSAPELLWGGAPSTKSDVWSYGIVLHEIFANGEEPYQGKTDMDVKDKVLSGYRLHRLPDCPESVFQMMSRCWDEDPTDRPDFKELEVFFWLCEKETRPRPEGDVIGTAGAI